VPLADLKSGSVSFAPPLSALETDKHLNRERPSRGLGLATIQAALLRVSSPSAPAQAKLECPIGVAPANNTSNVPFRVEALKGF
jgi:hypothetical protein